MLIRLIVHPQDFANVSTQIMNSGLETGVAFSQIEGKKMSRCEGKINVWTRSLYMARNRLFCMSMRGPFIVTNQQKHKKNLENKIRNKNL